jgi:hypothetical protein
MAWAKVSEILLNEKINVDENIFILFWSVHWQFFACRFATSVIDQKFLLFKNRISSRVWRCPTEFIFSENQIRNGKASIRHICLRNDQLKLP